MGLLIAKSTVQECSSYSSLRVLLVEDNKFNQTVTQALFKNFNTKTSITANGVGAIKLVSENEYDIIFIDMQMPIMDTDKTVCLEAGMKDFVSKPVQVKKIGSTLDHYFKQG